MGECAVYPVAYEYGCSQITAGTPFDSSGGWGVAVVPVVVLAVVVPLVEKGVDVAADVADPLMVEALVAAGIAEALVAAGIAEALVALGVAFVDADQ
jgi:hypothetical protein